MSAGNVSVFYTLILETFQRFDGLKEGWMV